MRCFWQFGFQAVFESALRLKLRFFLEMPSSQHPPSQVDIQYAIAMARGLVPPVRSLELLPAVPDGESKDETASDEEQETAASSAADGEKKEPAASAAASGADVVSPAPTAGSERRADAVTEFHMMHDTIEWQKYCWEVRNVSFVAYLKSLIGGVHSSFSLGYGSRFLCRPSSSGLHGSLVYEDQ